MADGDRDDTGHRAASRCWSLRRRLSPGADAASPGRRAALAPAAVLVALCLVAGASALLPAAGRFGAKASPAQPTDPFPTLVPTRPFPTLPSDVPTPGENTPTHTPTLTPSATIVPSATATPTNTPTATPSAATLTPVVPIYAPYVARNWAFSFSQPTAEPSGRTAR